MSETTSNRSESRARPFYNLVWFGLGALAIVLVDGVAQSTGLEIGTARPRTLSIGQLTPERVNLLSVVPDTTPFCVEARGGGEWCTTVRALRAWMALSIRQEPETPIRLVRHETKEAQ